GIGINITRQGACAKIEVSHWPTFRSMERMSFPRFIIAIIFAPLLAAITIFAQEKQAETELVATKCWAYEVQAGRRLASDGARVFVATSEARIDAVSLDGRKLWSSDLGGEIASNLLATKSGIYVASATSPTAEKAATASLRLLSLDTGITSQTIKLPDASQHFLHQTNGTLIVVSENGTIQSIEAKSGAVRWKREIAERFAGEPYFGNEKVIVASASKQLFTVLLASGEIESMRKLASQPTAALHTATGELVTGDERGGISFFLNDKNGEYWRFKSGASISSLRLIGSNFLSASNDNFIYMLTPRSGGMAWKRRLAGRVTHIGILENSLALVSSLEENGATFISLTGGKQLGQISLDEGEYLTADPANSSGLTFVLTNNRLIGYSLNGCPTAKESGPGVTPKPQTTKN
ncbi:MAG: PQQ-binding-like beta-propeller repeat protein, partial [Pyrinomonadaceae bacterium]